MPILAKEVRFVVEIIFRLVVPALEYNPNSEFGVGERVSRFRRFHDGLSVRLPRHEKVFENILIALI